MRYLIEYSLAELDKSFSENILRLLPEYQVLEPDMQRWFDEMEECDEVITITRGTSPARPFRW